MPLFNNEELENDFFFSYLKKGQNNLPSSSTTEEIKESIPDGVEIDKFLKEDFNFPFKNKGEIKENNSLGTIICNKKVESGGFVKRPFDSK